MRLNAEHNKEIFSAISHDVVKCVDFVTKAYYPESQKELVYVANEEDGYINHLFEQHHGFINKIATRYHFHFTYVPSLANQLNDRDILRYVDPCNTESRVPNTVGNDFLLHDIANPEDKAKFRQGIVFIQNRFGVPSSSASGRQEYTFVNSFFPLSSHSEKSLAKQLLEILFTLIYTGSLDDRQYSTRVLGCMIRDDEEAEDYADNHFNSQQEEESIDDLIEEIRERVEKLRQRGLAAYVLEELFHPEGKLSQMVITKDYRLLLTDYHDMEIKMEPLVKAVYLLFLNHPEGIRFKELPEYRKELTGIYLKLKPNGMTDRVKKSIEDVTNPLLNSINEKCARIRGAFVGQFDNYLAKYYYIDGLRAEPKKITLPRELVIWE